MSFRDKITDCDNCNFAFEINPDEYHIHLGKSHQVREPEQVFEWLVPSTPDFVRAGTFVAGQGAGKSTTYLYITMKMIDDRMELDYAL